MAILVATFAEYAHASGGTVYLATYFDMMPNAVVSGGELLERYREATRSQAGNQRTAVLQEIARPNRFAVLEVWSNTATLDAHDRAPSTVRVHERLKDIQSAPYDERVCRGLYIGRGKPASSYAMTGGRSLAMETLVPHLRSCGVQSS